MNMFEIDELVFSYPQKQEAAIKGINMRIPKGSFCAVVGRNGSGKSTLAQLLNGILSPSAGKIRVAGLDSSIAENGQKIRRLVGMVFQNPDNQLIASVVEEEVAFGLENLCIPPHVIDEKVNQALEIVGMSAYRFHSTSMLSGGQKQRIALAGVIAMQPECIILDEATSMLDQKSRTEIIEVIESLQAKEGCTVLMITNNMEEAARAERVFVLNNGALALEGTPLEVFEDFALLNSLGLDSPILMKIVDAINHGRDHSVQLTAINVEACAEAISSALKNLHQRKL